MSDLISREALYEQIALMRKDLGQRVLRVRLGSEKQIKYSNQLDAIDEIKSMVKDEPTVEAKEVVHGEWIVGSKPRCSVCGKPALREYDCEAWLSYIPSDFCPHCGADMRKKV